MEHVPPRGMLFWKLLPFEGSLLPPEEAEAEAEAAIVSQGSLLEAGAQGRHGVTAGQDAHAGPAAGPVGASVARPPQERAPGQGQQLLLGSNSLGSLHGEGTLDAVVSPWG